MANCPARRKLAARCLLAGLLLACAGGAPADDVLEQRVKSAFLFNFAKFVSWPPGKLAGGASTIVFCLLERDTLAPALDEALSGKTIDDHPLQLRRVARVEDFRGCHVAYLGAMDPARLPAALAGLDGGGVLTVYEADGAQHDGVVRFYLDERKVRFEINEAAAQREGLQLSSRLLSVASVVRD
ncbi:MAG: YfiR family protein [Nevskia sp.]|nr:YfiR family protein [Nevskia sp.]